MSTNILSNNNKRGDERMAVIETDIKYLKETTNRIEGKMDKFIDSASCTYATKEELCDVKNELSNSRNKVEDIDKKMFYFAGAVAVVVFIITLFVPKIISAWIN